MLDRAFKKELDVIPVVCMYRIDRQCTWTGQLKDYQVCCFSFENKVFFVFSKVTFRSKSCSLYMSSM
jgi:hypothetical protein